MPIHYLSHEMRHAEEILTLCNTKMTPEEVHWTAEQFICTSFPETVTCEACILVMQETVPKTHWSQRVEIGQPDESGNRLYTAFYPNHIVHGNSNSEQKIPYTDRDKENKETYIINKMVEFLTENGCQVNIRERKDPKADIDFRGTINGTPWAFEITQLRKDPKKDYHRKISGQERKPVSEQIEALAKPLPKIPEGAENLQLALNKAFEHGQRPNKVASLNGDRYCLIILNEQFHYIPDWEEINIPNTDQIDAVFILHRCELKNIKVWQVIKQEGIATRLESHDLEEMDRQWRIQ